jgi:hypothetical protein
MSSSISSSDRSAPAWRRFFWLSAAAAAAVTGVIYAFVTVLDPFDILPLSPGFGPVLVSTNQRFAWPALARSPLFDSAVFGSSTSMLLKPAVLDRAFDARFANLSLLASTYYEQTRLLAVFVRAHARAKWIVVSVDLRWCETGDDPLKLTARPFPDWMYDPSTWHGYREMLNLFAIQEAGKKLGLMTGLKKPELAPDGYTRFVPPDDRYDAARAAAVLRREEPAIPPGPRSGAPATWRFVAFEALRGALGPLSPETRVIVAFEPVSRAIIPPMGHPAAEVWDECKRRAAAIARERRRTMAVDFMRSSPISDNDESFWDREHYRVGVAERVAADLMAAEAGEKSPDYEVLAGPDR